MGVIKDIVDIVVPRAQNRIADEGINIKEALDIELKEIGYIPKKSKDVKQMDRFCDGFICDDCNECDLGCDCSDGCCNKYCKCEHCLFSCNDECKCDL